MSSSLLPDATTPLSPDALPPLLEASPPPAADALPPLTSPAPTQDSPPAPPPEDPPDVVSPPPPLAASAPSPSASLSPPVSRSSPAPPPPPSSSPTARSPPPPPSKTARPPPPPSKTGVSPPPPNASPPPPSILSPPPPPSSKTTQTPPPPPPPPTHVISSSPPPPASKSSSSTTPSSSSSSATAPPPLSSSSTNISGGSLIAIGISGILAISVLAVLFYCLCRKKKKYYYNGAPPHYKDSYSYYGADLRQQQEWCSPASDVLIKIPPPPGSQSMQFPRNGYDPLPSPPKDGGSPGIANSKSWFTYQELAAATNGFAKSNTLGEGGFGCVYKGTLSDGQLVAVKQLKAGASQGEKEFRAEVEIISRVHHRHLVSLVGYCIADRQRLLVYDYVPNGTLECHLHKRNDGPAMDWPTRLRIACGAARGLAYLHEDCHPRIIHRDIKSSNILLDNNFEAQVSDFGLAKLTSDTNTHVTTRVMGTFGYLAPEYASSGKLTDKSDVFSFGVVLLELLTGRKPVDPSQPAGEESLVEWARPVLAQVNTEEDLKEVADPTLNGAYDVQEMMRMMEAAAACVRHSANKRPRMGQVVRALEDESSLSDLNKGLKPGHSGVFGTSFASSDYENGGSYSADMRKYMRVALDSTQEFGSECSGATSEYGLNASVSSSEHKMSREMETNYSQHRAVPNQETDQNHSQVRPMQSREMDQNFSHQRPMPLNMRNNVHLYDTQQFRMGN